MQALLALTLVFAFMPIVAQRLVARDTDAQMYATTRQVETAQTAARIFIRENANNLPYNRTIVSGNDFADLLEPYGLPLGFVPRTPLGQNISLVIDKTADMVTAYLELSRGNLSDLRLAELSRRIGFYAVPNSTGISVGLALNDVYSDVVRRNEPDVNNSAFLTDLDMGAFVFDNVGTILARRGEFETAQFGTLTLTGTENGRKARNTIEKLATDKAVFQSRNGEAALSLTRGTLNVSRASAKTISRFGDTGAFTSDAASVYDFSMTAGRTSFSGPSKWDVRGNVISDNINFTVERLDVESYLNASRGQDVYVNPDSLEYSTQSGINTNTLIASNITMRDQTSDALLRGETGAVVLDVRPAGTSVLPDALVETINNGVFSIIEKPTSDESKTVDCRSIITRLDGMYNQYSLSQYIICQYVYWQRIERRIDAKQCLLEGRSGCL